VAESVDAPDLKSVEN